MAPIELTDDEWDTQYNHLLDRFTSLFTQAAPDVSVLGSELQELIQGHPTSACAEALASALINLSQSKPRSVDKPVEAISTILPSFKQLQVDFGGSPYNFDTVFTIRFLDLFKTVLYGLQLQDPTAPRRKLVAEDNPVLTSAVLCGSGVRHGLVSFGRTADSFVSEGLQLQKAESKKGSAEVKALASAIILAIAGKTFVNGFGTHAVGTVYSQDVVLTALKENVSSQVENEGAKRLLDDLITSGESGFERSWTSEEAWGKVFG